jgi:hypothetical protein
MTQRKFEKIMLMVLASVIMSIVCWTLIDNLIVPVSLIEYIFIEFLLVFAYKSYTFVVKQIQSVEE